MNKTQLCWSCQNAVPSAEKGCPWSEGFEPVDGWKAVPTVLAVMQAGRAADLNSFQVEECPLYLEDEHGEL